MPIIREKEELSTWMLGVLQSIDTAPVVGRAFSVIVFMNHEICMNQFGWSGPGSRSLLLLPISLEDHLAGKLDDLFRIYFLQALVTLPPLL